MRHEVYPRESVIAYSHANKDTLLMHTQITKIHHK